MRVDELKTITGAVPALVGAEVTLGTPVPVDMTRYIYRIKFTNLGAIANALYLGKRENGALVTSNIDQLQAAVVDEMITDPDELKEDAAPLYSIDGGPSAGPTATTPPSTSLVRVYGDVAAGRCTYWYIDAPSAT